MSSCAAASSGSVVDESVLDADILGLVEKKPQSPTGPNLRGLNINWLQLPESIQIVIMYELKQRYVLQTSTQLLALTLAEVTRFFEMYSSEWAKHVASERSMTATVLSPCKKEASSTPKQGLDDLIRKILLKATANEEDDDKEVMCLAALELTTTTISRGDVGKGKKFLRFMGLRQQASRLDKWLGTNVDFVHINFDWNGELDKEGLLPHCKGFWPNDPEDGCIILPRNPGWVRKVQRRPRQTLS